MKVPELYSIKPWEEEKFRMVTCIFLEPLVAGPDWSAAALLDFHGLGQVYPQRTTVQLTVVHVVNRRLEANQSYQDSIMQQLG